MQVYHQISKACALVPLLAPASSALDPTGFFEDDPGIFRKFKRIFKLDFLENKLKSKSNEIIRIYNEGNNLLNKTFKLLPMVSFDIKELIRKFHFLFKNRLYFVDTDGSCLSFKQLIRLACLISRFSTRWPFRVFFIHLWLYEKYFLKFYDLLLFFGLFRFCTWYHFLYNHGKLRRILLYEIRIAKNYW